MKQVDLKRLRLPGFEEAMRIIDGACKAAGVPYMLIGAVARDLLLSHLRGLDEEFSLTEDIDLSVSVAGWADYETLMRGLKDAGATPTEVWHRILVRNINVDVVPFGDVEDPSGIVQRKSWKRLNVAGYKTAFQHVEVIGLNGLVIRVFPLPAYVPAKVVAWSDRGAGKDAVDICTVLRNYFWTDTDLMLEQHADLFEEEGDNDLISARAYGLLVAESPAVAEELLRAAREVLTDMTTFERLVLSMGAECHTSVERRRGLLEAFLRGLND